MGVSLPEENWDRKAILLPSQTSGRQLYIFFFLGPSFNQNNWDRLPISLQFWKKGKGMAGKEAEDVRIRKPTREVKGRVWAAVFLSGGTRMGAGEMAKGLRTLIALPEDLGLAIDTHMMTHN